MKSFSIEELKGLVEIYGKLPCAQDLEDAIKIDYPKFGEEFLALDNLRQKSDFRLPRPISSGKRLIFTKAELDPDLGTTIYIKDIYDREIPAIPDGYELVAFRLPKADELSVDVLGNVFHVRGNKHYIPTIIVKKESNK